MFNKNDNKTNERIIYQARPNMILGCKKAILGVVLLIIVLSVSGPIIQFVGEMQVYLISQIKLSLTRYTAIAVFVVMLVIILYIIWQIVGWYAKEYILTDSRIIVKSGVLIHRKNYMPYSTVQDVNTSQSIFARLFNVGSVSVYSAYDNNQILIENISDPSKVEEIIFSKISRPRGFNPYPQQRYVEEFYQDDGYDDVVITPIGHEQKQYRPREYEYYPEDLDYNSNQRPHYDYEPYDESLEHNIDRAMGGRESYSPQNYPEESYYNEVTQDYFQSSDDYYYNNDEDFYYNEGATRNITSDDNKDISQADESSETVIKRHFDKFKK